MVEQWMNQPPPDPLFDLITRVVMATFIIFSLLMVIWLAFRANVTPKKGKEKKKEDDVSGE